MLSYGIAQRRHEIGCASPSARHRGAVRAMVVRRTAFLVVPGLAIGIAVSLGVTRVLAKFLFQVTPTDPATFTGVGILLALVALAAAYVPAKRASDVDPLVVLRD